MVQRLAKRGKAYMTEKIKVICLIRLVIVLTFLSLFLMDQMKQILDSVVICLLFISTTQFAFKFDELFSLLDYLF